MALKDFTRLDVYVANRPSAGSEPAGITKGGLQLASRRCGSHRIVVAFRIQQVKRCRRLYARIEKVICTGPGSVCVEGYTLVNQYPRGDIRALREDTRSMPSRLQVRRHANV